METFPSPLEGSVCLSLACYPVDSVAALMSTATESQPFDALIRQARIKSSWPSGSGFRSTLKDGSGKLYAIPPFSVRTGFLLSRPYVDTFVDEWLSRHYLSQSFTDDRRQLHRHLR